MLPLVGIWFTLPFSGHQQNDSMTKLKENNLGDDIEVSKRSFSTEMIQIAPFPLCL